MNDDFSFDDETKNILKKGVAEKKQGRPAKKEEQKRQASSENKEDPKKEVVKDPEMGIHIDISG